MRLFPTSDAEMNAHVFPTPPQSAGNFFLNVDQISSPTELESRLNLSADVFDGARCIFGFTYPSYLTSISYGDGNNVADRLGIASVSVLFRGRRNAAAVVLSVIAVRGGLDGTLGTVSISSTVTGSRPHSVTVDTDPLTGLPWLPSDLITTTFGLTLPVFSIGNFDLTSFRLVAEETLNNGNQRARLGPLRKEPALFCAMCSFPFHISDLIKVEDPRHPMIGRWVCRQDYDEIDPEDLEPRVIEGDIDFDL